MKVCGFSFLKNAVKYDFPFEESLRSLLPLCDEVIVAVGKSDDETLERIKSIDIKIKIIETSWDESQKEGGRVYALETDKAFHAIPSAYDWAFYLQGDEVIHEKYYPAIRNSMQEYLNQPKVDGLLFNYKHFFGSYDYVGAKYSWYRREIRIVRNNKNIFSFRDAQGFRKKPNEKLSVKLIDAFIYHYGWVRNPSALQQKINANINIYQGNNTKAQLKEMSKAIYDYDTANEPVETFTETHPAVMQKRILEQNWPFEPNNNLKYASAKDKLKRIVGKYTGWYIGEYKNYKKI